VGPRYTSKSCSKDRVLGRGLVRLEQQFVLVAPQPVLAALERLDQRMAGCLEMRVGMTIRRFVAAADVTADQADAQMDPRIAILEAFLAALRAGPHAPDLVQMCALSRHVLSFRF
jgi:hypothetical protein